MSKLHATCRGIAAVWHWLGGPWRSLKAFCVVLVNLSRQQMRSLFSIAMLGGIIALSFQNMGLIYSVRQLLGDALPGSLFGQMSLNQQLWNNIIILVFCVSLALIVWGADRFAAKVRGMEISASRGAPAAKPIPATIADDGEIMPDDNFEELTE